MLINFVYDNPRDDLYNYSVRVINEMCNRGYKLDLTKFYDCFAKDKIDYMKEPYPEKMDDEYLAICYFNLLEKYRCGGVTDEEWQKIDERAKQRVREWVINNLI